MFQHATLLLAALAVLAPLAEANLNHGSRRTSRHNSRALHRRAENDMAAAPSKKCKPRHPPAPASSALSLSSELPTATVASSVAATSAASATSAAHTSTKLAAPAPSSSASVSEAATTFKKPAHTSSSSSSSAQATSTSGSSSSSGGSSSLRAALFPVAEKQAWTMASALSGAVSFTASNLNIVSEIKSLSNPIGTHAGRTAMQASFPQGNWGLNKGIDGGMSWYGQGQTSAEDWQSAKEITFGYGLYFSDDYGWNKGGKLPGLCACCLYWTTFHDFPSVVNCCETPPPSEKDSSLGCGFLIGNRTHVRGLLGKSRLPRCS